MGRPLLQKDVDAAYEHFARVACDLVNEGHTAFPQVVFVQMHDAEPGVIANFYTVDPEIVLRLNNLGSAGKRALATVIAASLGDADASPYPLREALIESRVRADIAVQLSEAWVAVGVPKDDALRELQPSQRVDRTEALVVLAHVKGHTAGQMMPITTTAGRRSVEFVPLLSHRGGLIGGDMAMQGWDDVPEGLMP